MRTLTYTDFKMPMIKLTYIVTFNKDYTTDGEMKHTNISHIIPGAEVCSAVNHTGPIFLSNKHHNPSMLTKVLSYSKV